MAATLERELSRILSTRSARRHSKPLKSHEGRPWGRRLPLQRKTGRLNNPMISIKKRMTVHVSVPNRKMGPLACSFMQRRLMS